MPTDTASAIAYVGAFAGLVGGGVALFNSWKAVRWKRAELANAYLKDFNSNPELVFAGRCLDWNGGRLALPENLRAYADNALVIQHDRRVFERALRPDLLVGELDEDPRIQVYRVAIDSFLSWLSLVASAIERKLFFVEDIDEVGYWLAKLESEPAVLPFLVAYGYQNSLSRLTSEFRSRRSTYQRWWFPLNLAGVPTAMPSCTSGDRTGA
jgi:hypothetical protein